MDGAVPVDVKMDREQIQRLHSRILKELRDNDHVLRVEGEADEMQRREMAERMEAAEGRLKIACQKFEYQRDRFWETQARCIEHRFASLAFKLLQREVRRESSENEIETYRRFENLAAMKRRELSSGALARLQADIEQLRNCDPKTCASLVPSCNGDSDEVPAEAELLRLQSRLETTRELKRKRAKIMALRAEVTELERKVAEQSGGASASNSTPTATTAQPGAGASASNATPTATASQFGANASGSTPAVQATQPGANANGSTPAAKTTQSGQATPPPVVAAKPVGGPPKPIGGPPPGKGKGGGKGRPPPKAKAKISALPIRSNGLVNLPWRETTEEIKESDLQLDNDGFLNPFVELMPSVATVVDPSPVDGKSPASGIRDVTGTAFSANRHEIAEMVPNQLRHFFQARRITALPASNSKPGAAAETAPLGDTEANEDASHEEPKRTLKVLDEATLKTIGVLVQRFRMKLQSCGLSSVGYGDNLVAEIKRAVFRCTHTPETCHMLRQVLASQADKDRSVKEFVAKHGGEQVLSCCQSALEHMLVYEITQIPSVDERLRCMIFEATWAEEARKLCKDLQVLQEALLFLIDRRSAMSTFLRTACALGNALNEDSFAPYATRGFRISSVPKLVQLKSPVRAKLTMIHFVVALMDEADVDAFCMKLSILAMAKDTRSGSCALRFRDIVKDFLQFEKLCKTVQSREQDPDDHFQRRMQAIVARSRCLALRVVTLARSIFQKYWELAVFLEDPAALYPPPQRDGDTTEDIFDFFYRFGTQIGVAKSECKTMRLRKEIVSGRMGIQVASDDEADDAKVTGRPSGLTTPPGAAGIGRTMSGRRCMPTSDGGTSPCRSTVGSVTGDANGRRSAVLDVAVRRLRDTVSRASVDTMESQSDVSDWGDEEHKDRGAAVAKSKSTKTSRPSRSSSSGGANRGVKDRRRRFVRPPSPASGSRSDSQETVKAASPLRRVDRSVTPEPGIVEPSSDGAARPQDPVVRTIGAPAPTSPAAPQKEIQRQPMVLTPEPPARALRMPQRGQTPPQRPPQRGQTPPTQRELHQQLGQPPKSAPLLGQPPKSAPLLLNSYEPVLMSTAPPSRSPRSGTLAMFRRSSGELPTTPTHQPDLGPRDSGHSPSGGSTSTRARTPPAGPPPQRVPGGAVSSRASFPQDMPPERKPMSPSMRQGYPSGPAMLSPGSECRANARQPFIPLMTPGYSPMASLPVTPMEFGPAVPEPQAPSSTLSVPEDSSQEIEANAMKWTRTRQPKLRKSLSTVADQVESKALLSMLSSESEDEDGGRIRSRFSWSAAMSNPRKRWSAAGSPQMPLCEELRREASSADADFVGPHAGCRTWRNAFSHADWARSGSDPNSLDNANSREYAKRSSNGERSRQGRFLWL
eukprot:TRINITY_DN5086_c0_g1_i2.p1 TRINITY_DN5086_c0_g1~~TRINITY_DN5086_c0_g1_i2.p1  ORF type:complete len:1388 (+),score=246.12 TRINITY_DN5086_c0_g1_i2:77-4240(+)